MAPAIEAVSVPSPVRAGETRPAFPPPARDGALQTGRSRTNRGQRPTRRARSARRGRSGRWAGALAPGWARISAALGQGRCPCHGGRVRPFTPAVAASSAACRRLKARHDPSRPDRDVCPGSSRTTRGIPRRQLSARRVCPPGGAATALPVGPPRTPTRERPAGRITAGARPPPWQTGVKSPPRPMAPQQEPRPQDAKGGPSGCP
jgi:hypothetical protein